MLQITASQIEIEQIFSVIGVITNLWHSEFGIENLDCLILVVKNWPNDVCVGCIGGKHENM
jgi:hypothetical protein